MNHREMKNWIYENGLKTLGASLLLLYFNGCGQTPTTTPASGTFSAVYVDTLSKACIECHVPSGAATAQDGVQLDFSSPTQAYNSLLNSTVHGSRSVGTCGSVKIVTVSNATTSYLAGVLFSDYYKSNFGGVSGCTPYAVHLQDQSLSADEKASIISWIKGGALNN